MSRYKAYPEYKDSGVEWLGLVPKNWKICRIKNISTVNPAKSEARALAPETEVSFIPMEAIGENGELDASRTKSISEVISGYSYVADGDIMIAKITPCFENGKGAVVQNLVNGIGFATTEVINVRPNSPEDSAFLFYLLSAAPFRRLAEGSMYGAGGQKRVADSFVAEYHLSLPGCSERTKIAAFLDHETARIDVLIEKQQRLIELLKEKRQAAISHAVTKGLNPNAPMKDSGVEWLGEVPAHWAITQLKYATSMIVDCPHETPIYSEDGQYLVIRTADLDEGHLDSSRMYRVEEDEYILRIRRSDLRQGDIVYGREGERWGHAGLIPEDGRYCLGQRMMQFRVNPDFCPDFLMWLLNSDNVYKQGQLDTVGATSPHVNVATIRNYSLVQPPLSEQKDVALFLNEKTHRFDALAGKASNTVLLLQERRSALISAAVTGKIDVRDWQAAA